MSMECIGEQQLNIIANQLSRKVTDQYKHIFLDIDGTIITNDGICNPSILKCVNLLKDKKWNISIATGRSICESKAILSQLIPNMPVICSNGQILYDNDKNTMLKCTYMDVELHSLITKIPQHIYIAIDVGDSIIANSKFMATILKMYFGIDIKNIFISHEIPIKEITKIYFCSPKNEVDFSSKIESILTDTSKADYSIQKFDSIIAASSGTVNKGKAMEELSLFYELEIDRTIFIGDGDNDIELLKNVGCGITLQNATEKAKKAADIVVPIDSIQGVVWILSKLLSYIN